MSKWHSRNYDALLLILYVNGGIIPTHLRQKDEEEVDASSTQRKR